MKIRIQKLKLFILPLSLDGLHIIGYEFSCDKKYSHILDNFIAPILVKLKYSAANIRALYPKYSENQTKTNNDETTELGLLRKRATKR